MLAPPRWTEWVFGYHSSTWMKLRQQGLASKQMVIEYESIILVFVKWPPYEYKTEYLNSLFTSSEDVTCQVASAT